MIQKPATSVVSCMGRCTQRDLPLVCSSADQAKGLEPRPPPAKLEGLRARPRGRRYPAGIGKLDSECRRRRAGPGPADLNGCEH
jgi:hypothetical protein